MQIERHGEVALLRLAAGKGNAIRPEFLDAFDLLLDEFDAEPSSALVLTGYERFFSTGLDLLALSELDRPRLGAFMLRFRDVMLRVFRAPVPVVAAINGHAVAGGCVLALQADYRVQAAGDYRVGLNEARLGVGLPAVAIEALRLALPAGSWLPVALQGRLFPPDEARTYGLVDEVVAPAAVEPRALEKARELGATPHEAWAQIKCRIRRAAIEAVECDADPYAERWLDSWFSAEARRLRAAALERMRR